MKKARIVVIGGGFAGVKVVRALTNSDAEITLVDKNNYSLFQPFLYQVATSFLSSEQIGVPLRTIFRKYPNVKILMGEVKRVKPETREVILQDLTLQYDYLILASGVQYNYFGHEEWRRFAPSLKSVDDADNLRKKILSSFEKAEIESDPLEIKRLMTFVLVGGGPTGVELAGTLAALTRSRMMKDYRKIKPEKSRVIIIESGATILGGFRPSLCEDARRYLKKQGVEIRTCCKVTQVDETGVHFDKGDKIESRNVIWTAGVKVPEQGDWLGAPTDAVGRVKVKNDLSVPNHPDVFVIGDAAYYEQDGKALPGVAQVALQMGSFVAEVLKARLENKTFSRKFKYKNRGDMAIIGKTYAIAQFPFFAITGRAAWLIWAIVHVIYNFNLMNRITVVFNWVWTFCAKTTTSRLLGTPRAESSSREIEQNNFRGI
jgi:NADH dehydrogenase